MTSTIARLTSLLLALVLAAGSPALAGSPVLPGPEDRRAEDAAAAAERAEDDAETLREDLPPVHDRRTLPAYEDALERAEREAERAEHAAENAERDASRAERRAERRARRLEKIEERREERDERRQREIDRNLGRR